MRIYYTYSNTPLNENLLFSQNTTIAKKQNTILLYEKDNHLGNVRVVVSDMKLWDDLDTDDIPDGGEFTADTKVYNNFYAFGSPQPLRSYNPTDYRYGAGGQEKVDEISGSGNHNTALYWEYDTRLGRRWNRDPIIEIGISDYACFGNNPILYSDPLGDFKTKFGAKVYAFFRGGEVGKDKGGEYFVGKMKDYAKGDDGVTYQRKFDWSGRNSGTNLDLQNRIDDRISEMNFENILDDAGIEHHRTDDINEAKLGILKLGTSVIMPQVISNVQKLTNIAKAENSVVKGISEASPYELEITHALTKSKNAFSKLKANIKANGIQEPIKFVERNGKRYVVDGHHRLRAAKELSIPKVPVEKVELPYGGYKTADDLIYSH